MARNDKTVKTVNEWLKRNDLEDGYTIANAHYRREYNRFSKELRKAALYLYVLGVEMKIYYCTKMMYSAKRQSRFCNAVAAELRHKKVDKEHYKAFDRDVKSIERRLETINRIIKEDIHLTEYEPFFEAEVVDYDFTDFKDIPKIAKDWNERHKDLVEKHLNEIKPELERHEKYIQQVAEKRKAEKEYIKQKKKAEDEYVKEIKNNAARNKAEYKKLERSFQRYYEGNY